MTNEESSPRWRWDLESKIQNLDQRHESAYRELRDFRVSTTTRLDRIDADLRTLDRVSVQVENLTEAIRKLGEQLEGIVTTSTSGRRAEWGTAIQIIGLVIMAFLTSAALLLNLLHSGGIPR